MAGKTNGAASAKAQAGSITKMEAVGRALGELGKTAMPLQIQKLVKERFGVVMNVSHISNCKTEIQRQAKGKKKPPVLKAVAKHPPAPKNVVATKPSPQSQGKPAPAPAAKAAGISLDDIRTAKELVGRVGADRLRKLIDVLSR